MRRACSWRVGLVAVSGLLFSAGVARAHGTISPATAPTGISRFVISVPNESRNVPITGFKLTAPAGVTILGAESESGFRGVAKATSAEWDDGSIFPPDTAIFAFTATIPVDSTRVVFQGEEVYGPIESGTFPLAVRIDSSLVAATTETSGQGSTGRTVLWVGLAATLTLAAVALFFFVGRRHK